MERKKKLGIENLISGDRSDDKKNISINNDIKNFIIDLYENAMNSTPEKDAPRIPIQKRQNIDLYKELLEALRVYFIFILLIR